jgi:hypothetical protein
MRAGMQLRPDHHAHAASLLSAIRSSWWADERGPQGPAADEHDHLVAAGIALRDRNVFQLLATQALPDGSICTPVLATDIAMAVHRHASSGRA